ncbi:MAG: hypothetical protein Q8O42_03805 [Acidobacteriota bacterium]|nr:hypothetical protein [Acidobacteriota bacterium]
MKRQTSCVLALVMAAAVASSAADAQGLGGLIRKKAGEVVGGKKPAPAPAPATAAPAPDATATTPAAPVTTGESPATPAAAKPAAKAEVSALEASELPVRQSSLQVLRGRVNLRDNGDWDQLPYIPTAAVAAAYALSDAAQVTLVETVGSALKALVTSATFLGEHNQFIKSEYNAVDHGLKGVVGVEAAMRKNDLKAIEAIQSREVVANLVDQVQSWPADMRKTYFSSELANWKKYAADPKRRDQAKYQKLVALAQPLETMAAGDEQWARSFAVILSIDNGGPDTEAAVFAMHQRVKQEREQLAYDEHNMPGRLKRELTTFVAVASKVNFSAPTVEKGGKTVFVNAADERQGALWKACFRAGEAPTAAAVKLARAWLAELSTKAG